MCVYFSCHNDCSVYVCHALVRPSVRLLSISFSKAVEHTVVTK